MMHRDEQSKIQTYFQVTQHKLEFEITQHKIDFDIIKCLCFYEKVFFQLDLMR